VPPTSYPARAEHTDPDFPGGDFAHGSGWGLPPSSPVPQFRSAGVAALLTTARDRLADWINAGQALQRILLTASTCGIAAALHTQPLELGWLRDSIRTRLSDGAYPQLVLRFGAVIQAAASVRRPLEDILSESGSEDTNAGAE
jgi:hypothetical protein